MSDPIIIIKRVSYSEAVKRAQQKYYMHKKAQILAKNNARYKEKTKDEEYKKTLALRARTKRQLQKTNDVETSDEQPKRGRPKMEPFKLLFNKVIREINNIITKTKIFKLINE